ncbi:MAG: dTDP-4-dehydrorhamnose 3,5-epimerase [Lentisphaeraceae bacterium]|nr:dTDP-4-dehydrorhamnose 3,5-epimerase [Lentisphaeraceae bacterium]
MEITETNLDGVLVLEPRVFGDERGFFMETFNQQVFNERVGEVTFVQDNHSKSSKGVLRGLHFQDPQAQGKLVRVTVGAVYDVAVDIRPESPSFGKWFGLELTADNKKQLWIPAGLAHGFLTLQDNTEFLYKCTDFYAPHYDNTLMWNDPELAIEWPKLNVDYQLSEKDQAGKLLGEFYQVVK